MKNGKWLGITSVVTGAVGLFIYPLLFSTLAIIFGSVGATRKHRYWVIGLITGAIGWIIGIYILINFGLDVRSAMYYTG